MTKFQRGWLSQTYNIDIDSIALNRIGIFIHEGKLLNFTFSYGHYNIEDVIRGVGEQLLLNKVDPVKYGPCVLSFDATYFTR